MPSFFPLVLRAWGMVGGADQDGALRFLGFLVAVATFGAVWLSARALAVTVPLFGLVVFALHGVVLQTVGSVKPYGLGVVLLCLVVGGLWRVVSIPSTVTVIGTSVIAMLAVNTVYQNLPVIMACCLAGGLVAAVSRDWKAAGRVSVVATMTVVSLLPYASVVARSSDWRPLVRTDNTLGRLTIRLTDIFADWNRPLRVVWLLACVVGILAAIDAVRRAGPRTNARSIYAALVAIGAPLALIVFFQLAAGNLEPWHVASLIGVVALGLDVLLARTFVLRSLRVVLVVAAAVIVLPLSSNWVGVRQTNVDLIATFVKTAAQDGDAIVVNPWFLGITFNRYYDGRVSWITVPPIRDVRIHRYDLVKEQMADPETMTPVYRAIRTALESGHQVWLVGGAQFIPPDQTPETLPAAPAAPTGWQHPAYYRAWSRGIGRFVETHATHLEIARVEAGQPVWRLEGATLMVAYGWRTP
jgi:hypothetical protein